MATLKSPSSVAQTRNWEACTDSPDLYFIASLGYPRASSSFAEERETGLLVGLPTGRPI